MYCTTVFLSQLSSFLLRPSFFSSLRRTEPPPRSTQNLLGFAVCSSLQQPTLPCRPSTPGAHSFRRRVWGSMFLARVRRDAPRLLSECFEIAVVSREVARLILVTRGPFLSWPCLVLGLLRMVFCSLDLFFPLESSCSWGFLGIHALPFSRNFSILFWEFSRFSLPQSQDQ